MKTAWVAPVAAVCFLGLLGGGCFNGPLPDLEDGRVGERTVAALSSSGSEELEPLAVDEVAARLAEADLGTSVGEPIARGSSHLLPVTVSSSDALATWTLLRNLLRDTGWWPVVAGAPEAIEEVRAQVAEYETEPVPEILRRAAELSVSRWARDRRSDFQGSLKDYRSPWSSLVSRDEPNRQLFVHHDYTAEGEVLPDEILVVLIPTPHGWEAPAYLGFGGFNDCPPAEVLVSFLHRWHQAVGAEVASISWSVLELVVPEPVGDERLALDLARERFQVCPDQIFQGFRDLDHIASAVQRDQVWFFWWD